LIYLGQFGYYPTIINKLQIPRAIPFIALLLPFCFASFLHTAFSKIKSRLLYSLFIILTAVGITHSIEISSIYSGQPVESIQNPVAEYFADKNIPKGSVYVKDVAPASFFGKSGLRFITSYNRFPNPFPIRFNSLMKTDISYTGVTPSQIKRINDYATVLGVEYIFIPKLSPLVNGLTMAQGNADTMFENVGEANGATEVFSVLRNLNPIAYAYAIDKNEIEKFLRFSELPKPTLQVDSYKLWDEEISRMAQLIRSGQIKSLPMDFIWSNKLTVVTESIRGMKQPTLFIAQSYDQNWSVENDKSAVIIPTNLRFMSIDLTEEEIPNSVTLSNNWPFWHWPVQLLGLVMIILTSVIAVFRKRKIISSTNN
jgi:hypothetical protein